METKQLIHVPPAFSGKCGASSGGRRQGRSAFTPAQLHELHQQSLIFSYIVAGLSVPFPLILPIWRSVARSSDYANGEIYNQYPSFIGFGPQGYDYRITMDPEPGRCRRTDGKKWRCSKEVVSDQKYCERHMHRGCRSRKRVKAYISTPESATATTALNHNNTATIKSSASTNTESNQSILVPVNLQLATPSSNSGGNTYAAKAPTTIPTANISGINEQDNKVDAKKDATSTATTVILTTYGSNKESNKRICGKDATDTTTCLTGAATDNKSNSRNDNDCVNEEDAICNHLDKRVNIERSINKGNNVNAGSLVASGFGFSPKSVLQAVGSSSSCLDYRNFIETEMQRCRRTDGKKWRCSNEVIPDQKYCGRHLHRGAKKLVVAAQSVTVAAAPPLPPSSLYLAPPLAIPKKTYGHKNLDTNLSISIASSSQHMTCDEKSSTSNSSSSDATTITDENGSISHLLALSP